MIAKTIEAAMLRRWLVLAIAVFIVGFGCFAFHEQPIDAYPDIRSEERRVGKECA